MNVLMVADEDVVEVARFGIRSYNRKHPELPIDFEDVPMGGFGRSHQTDWNAFYAIKCPRTLLKPNMRRSL